MELGLTLTKQHTTIYIVDSIYDTNRICLE